MPATRQPMRYAHSEGHTDLCYDENGRYMLTCGGDGYVRIWESLDDNDAISHQIGENVFAVACKKDTFATASDTLSVQLHGFPMGEPEGIITRFTAPVSHMCFNKSGSLLLAGSSDFTIKLVSVTDKTSKVFHEHTAPVLSVSLDPLEEYVASSSCDGTVKIWTVADQLSEMTWNVLPKTNDITFSKTLCRVSWSPITAECLAIPVDKEVQLMKRDTWELAHTLTHEDIKEVVSIATFSPCGNFLAAACRDGLILVWDVSSRQCIERQRHDKNLTICSLVWNPKKKGELAYSDTQGQLGVIGNIIPEEYLSKERAANVGPSADLFADSDDDMLLTAAAQAGDADDDDDDEFDFSKQKKRLQTILDGEDTMDSAVVPIATDKMAAGGDAAAVIPMLPRATTPLQPSFQPGATPVELSHRFMVWNSVGMVRSYNTEEENSIDIVFHDTGTHHTMHISNQSQHTMCDISAEAVLLACEGDADEYVPTPSQLTCMHYSSWDSCKDWNVTMPENENIKAVCLGTSWVAVATDQFNLRLFTVGGLQREIFSIPGPVVCMAGHSNQLIVVFHLGTGVPGDQCLGVTLMHLDKTVSPVLDALRLPISPKSRLSWLGFSSEGTPVTMDSCGIVRILNRSFHNVWSQLANTKSQVKGKSDNFWMVGVTENPAQLRCILCKGKTYPATLPLPIVTLQPCQLPLCEMSTEKSQQEEQLWRSRLLSGHLGYLPRLGLECEEDAVTEAIAAQQEVLIKMFALCCRSEREFRAAEICEQYMTMQALQLAIKYASRMKHTSLANRLNDLMRYRMEKEEEEEEAARTEQEAADDGDCDFRAAINAGYNHSETEWAQDRLPQRNGRRQHRDDEDKDEEAVDDDNEDAENEDESETLISYVPKKAKMPQRFLASSGTVTNPFKVASQIEATPPVTSVRGTGIFDSMRKPTQKSQQSSWKTVPSLDKNRQQQRKKKVKAASKQQSLTDTLKTAVPNSDGPSMPNQTAFRRVSGLQLWREANRDEIREEHPELAEDDDEDHAVAKLYVQLFKQLPKEEREQWNERAKSELSRPAIVESSLNRKRKRDIEGEEEEKEDMDASSKDIIDRPTIIRPTSGSSKLSSFAFKKDE
ncbi:PREDICTED: WD repeat and HMG-box DNA-binding protein 1-like isoform X2 [Priapulus caudatus]|uniref:WD repeat and HMG-box DNA-binding protein 1-like isoform X2 n=1 Tax=Priapulus caudatus TaxID=37621 RepID=A0ABM1DRT9_PRICU|nr:PREDICTED: WD repeat and HMG-box DNA-binding protein 1-like isoform X2 [Priapulus caudatus]